VDAEWAAIGTAISRLRMHRGELEAAAITASGAAESARASVRSRERALGIAGEEQRRIESIVQQAEEKKAAAQSGVDKAQKALRAAGASNARFEKMRAVQATVAQLSDAISQAGAKLRAAEGRRSALQREIADLNDRKAVLTTDVADVDARLAARREQAGVSSGTDAELKARLAELAAGLQRATTESSSRIEAGRASLQSVAQEKAKALSVLDDKLRAVLQVRGVWAT
jgi:chromosome segregation ATPase